MPCRFLRVLLPILFSALLHLPAQGQTDSIPACLNCDNPIYYSVDEVLAFADSIAKADLSPQTDWLKYYYDSVMVTTTPIGKSLSPAVVEELLAEAPKESITPDLYKGIFGGSPPADLLHKERVLVTLIPLSDENEPNQDFAVMLGSPSMSWENDIYFFRDNRLIEKRSVSHKYNLDMKFYRLPDGSKIIYWVNHFGSGTGVWQFNYSFYHWGKKGLKLVLNLLESGNLAMWVMSPRNYQWNAKVTSTHPLQVEVTYEGSITTDRYENRLIYEEGVTTLNFDWDAKAKTYKPDPANRFDQHREMTYHTFSESVLFINTYYELIQELLKNPDQKKVRAVLRYLASVYDWQKRFG